MNRTTYEFATDSRDYLELNLAIQIMYRYLICKLKDSLAN